VFEKWWNQWLAQESEPDPNGAKLRAVVVVFARAGGDPKKMVSKVVSD
jgi:hypothetical protein